VKINPITTVSSVQLSNVGGTNEVRSGKPKANQPVVQDAAVASVTSPSPLSDETKKSLTFATQEVASHGEHTHKVPPSQQARAAIAANSELAAVPFGQIVSAIARGETLPTVAAESQHDEEPALDPVVDEPTTQPVTEPPAENLDPTADVLISDLPATGLTTDPVIDELLNPLSPPEGV
jgi:hypothetical protein